MEEHPVVRASQESGGCGTALLCVFGFCLVGFLGLWLVVAISYDGAQTPPSVSEKSLEYQLAYIHNGLLGVSPKRTVRMARFSVSFGS